MAFVFWGLTIVFGLDVNPEVRVSQTVDLRPLADALLDHQDWMLGRIFELATKAEYTRYTSTKEEEWRMTLREPSRMLAAYLVEHSDPESFHVDEVVADNPRAAFGVMEAKLHRSRGVTLPMFLGLTKQLRQVFIELTRRVEPDPVVRQRGEDIIHRFWDKFELGFCAEWARHGEEDLLAELQETNRGLTNAKNRYLTIFRSMSQPALVMDDDATVLEANPAFQELMGLSTERITGRLCPDVLGQSDDAGCPVLVTAQTGEPVIDHEIRVETPRGERTLLLSCAPLADVSGRNRGVIGLLNDITDRLQAEQAQRKLEAKVQQTQKLESLGLLAGGIAHDFNNMLMGIVGNASMAIEDLSPVSPVREYVEDIELAARRASELSKQMLAYSGRGRFMVERLDLSEVVREMSHLLQASLNKKAVLRPSFATNLPRVEADATQLRQVIMNLITNAADAIGERSGIITVITGAQDCSAAYLSGTLLDDDLPAGTYVFIEVSDTGQGVAPETLARVFDPFFTTKVRGRGLGLAAVLGIVRGHKGAIQVYSEPGMGTTFKVLLPAAEIAAQDAPEPTSPRFRGSGRVLLVDDDPTARAVGRRMLERAGFQVTTANDGLQAVDRFEAEPDAYTLVVLDLTMPHMDGETCFRELRQIRGDVRVILTSGYNSQEVVTRFAGKGLAGFIQKPFDAGRLRGELAKVMGTVSP